MKDIIARIKNIKAFSLAELSVAFGILAFTITSLLYFFIVCLAMNDANSDKIIAAHDAEYVLEQIIALPTNDFNALDAYVAPDILTNATTRNLRNETIVVNRGAGFNFRTVSVTVGWDEKNNRVRNFTLTTQIARTN